VEEIKVTLKQRGLGAETLMGSKGIFDLWGGQRGRRGELICDYVLKKEFFLREKHENFTHSSKTLS